MKIKLKQIKDKIESQRDAIQTLASGYILKVDDLYFKFDEFQDELILLSASSDYNWKVSHVNVIDICNSCSTVVYAQVEEDIQWYDNIPKQGILCNVGNVPSEKYRRVVIRYNSENDRYPFLDETGNHHRFAEPLTENELKAFIYEN